MRKMQLVLLTPLMDPETGFYYARNRYYSSLMGRFLTLDPIGVWGDAAGGGNGYQYGASRPVDSIDPLGLYTIVVVFDSGDNLGKNANARAQALVADDPEGGAIVTVDGNGYKVENIGFSTPTLLNIEVLPGHGAKKQGWNWDDGSEGSGVEAGVIGGAPKVDMDILLDGLDDAVSYYRAIMDDEYKYYGVDASVVTCYAGLGVGPKGSYGGGMGKGRTETAAKRCDNAATAVADRLQIPVTAFEDAIDVHADGSKPTVPATGKPAPGTVIMPLK